MLKVRLLGDRKSRDNILNISSAASLEKAMSSTYPLPPWRRQCPQHILCHLLGEGNVLNIPSASLEKAISSTYPLPPPWRRQCPQHTLCLLGEGIVLSAHLDDFDDSRDNAIKLSSASSGE